MSKKQIDILTLAQFTGSVTFTKHWLGSLITTEGVDYLVKTGEANWFLDVIATEFIRLGKIDEFWIIELIVEGNHGLITAKLDSDKPAYQTKKIHHTDFPEGVWKFYLQTNERGHGSMTLMLPGEY